MMGDVHLSKETLEEIVRHALRSEEVELSSLQAQRLTVALLTQILAKLEKIAGRTAD
jgi:hypothetical protein